MQAAVAEPGMPGFIHVVMSKLRLLWSVGPADDAVFSFAVGRLQFSWTKLLVTAFGIYFMVW